MQHLQSNKENELKHSLCPKSLKSMFTYFQCFSEML